MSNRVDATRAETLAEEQRHLDEVYGRLDALRERAETRRAEVLLQSEDTPVAQRFRESVATKYTQDMVKLTAVENDLCFGRLDLTDGEVRHIGRIGILDAEHNPLLIDWRAEAARQFYLATAARPGDVRRRRHINTRQRKVTGVTDEVLDLGAPRDSWHEELTGEAALMAALDAERTGKMRDIVATIQSEQDAIIRSELDGILVVAGGPGTGKTAVALHRAAYLLYEHAEKLAGRGVLLIGPNSTFLGYIGDVLPGLAETDVLLRTMSTLYPGVEATREEDPGVAAVKGDIAMVDVIAAAVADRQQLPKTVVDAETEYGKLVLDRQTCERARAKARASGKRHNQAREVLREAVLDAFTEAAAQRVGADPLGGDNLLSEADLAEIRRELSGESEVLAVMDWLWPNLTPQQLLAGLFGSSKRMAVAMPHLNAEQRARLARGPHSGWAASDVPLLDEAAELLGDLDDSEARARRARRDSARAAYAQGVLDIVFGSRSIDLEDEADPDADLIMATDVIDKTLLGERHAEDEYLSTAERAAADREWTFGHIVVDEAQELSAMAWRMIMRRSPSRSMTIVGDLAQAGEEAGAASWNQILEPYVRRWRLEELSVGYRTPAEIMERAAVELAHIDPDARVPRAVRATGVPPWEETVADVDLDVALRKRVGAELDGLDSGRLGVIGPRQRIGEINDAIGSPESVTVLAVRDAKGLEFDAVIVVDPDAIVAESGRGHSDLYVALTRATQRLGILRIT
ncbi:HelD family protein [Stackebrandtia nassauensis]|uniref:Superfamily I DNA and RNA helicase-like protein n=1 Tax=Stackebrandtia nassauensis (strain DSM 44728 / CIP 108903 / NRRL B-16338 / NBRC 102104 / LLR-40K-21) TaxID=446470 RepID=D3Q1X7_STANL|nr:AAA family ATPase [Stackebrandtia nassauensis]ADD41844.1 Superfamily I DNA and RNA helicase-like protein [Stackebrandtia nassauensis DSM 44728]